MAYANKAALKADALSYSLRSEADYDKMIQRAEEALNRELVPLREREVAGAAFTLASDSSTNWLLQNGSDAYLWAVLVEVYVWARDFETAATFKQRLDSTIEGLTWESAREDSQEPLTVDPALVLIRPFDIITGL
jgi:hypothetical protein